MVGSEERLRLRAGVVPTLLSVRNEPAVWDWAWLQSCKYTSDQEVPPYVRPLLVIVMVMFRILQTHCGRLGFCLELSIAVVQSGQSGDLCGSDPRNTLQAFGFFLEPGQSNWAVWAVWGVWWGQELLRPDISWFVGVVSWAVGVKPPLCWPFKKNHTSVG